MEAIDYFKDLDSWCNRFNNVTLEVAKRMINEYDYIIGRTKFSQIEICRILNSKK